MRGLWSERATATSEECGLARLNTGDMPFEIAPLASPLCSKIGESFAHVVSSARCTAHDLTRLDDEHGSIAHALPMIAAALLLGSIASRSAIRPVQVAALGPPLDPGATSNILGRGG